MSPLRLTSLALALSSTSIIAGTAFGQSETAPKEVASPESQAVKPSSSAKTSSTKPLLFQASKNGLQVLPQRFEYTLIDSSTLRIGDIMINSKEMSFDIVTNKNNQKQLVFKWPAALLSEGSIVLKNNNGKAIYSSDFNEQKIKKVKSSTELSEEDKNENYRTDIAQFVSEPIEKSLFDDMKYFPFMSICVFRDSEETRTSLCSNELYLSSDKGQLVIKSRATTSKMSFVEVNGKVVGNQGIIFLNDRSENIEFRTQMESGASLEISTRLKAVDFKDIVLDDDGKRIILTAKGADPVHEDKVRRLPNGDWQTRLSQSRPQVWLKGDGDIPMRQEFYIRGIIPSEGDRAYVSAKTQDRIFGSKTKVQGISRPDVQVSSFDETSSIEPSGKSNQFIWTVSELPSGVETRRYLNIKKGEKSFVAGMDFLRGTPYLFRIGSSFNSPSGQILGQIGLTWWLEDFMTSNSNWAKFHWGTALEHELQASKKADDTKVSSSTIHLLYRLKAGFPYVEDTWGLGLNYKALSIGSANLGLVGFRFFGIQQMPSSFKKWAQFYESRFDYYLGGNSQGVKIDSAMDAQIKLIKPLKDWWHVNYGVGYSSIKTKPNDSKNSNIKILVETEFKF